VYIDNEWHAFRRIQTHSPSAENERWRVLPRNAYSTFDGVVPFMLISRRSICGLRLLMRWLVPV
jgi:hypothetical protein